jgi:nicotinamidase-related amidase
MRPVIDGHIVPSLHAARDSPLTVVHCPGPAVASAYPEFHATGGSDDENRDGDASSDGDEWPPAAFRDRTGDARVFSRYEDEEAMAAADFDWPPDGIDAALEPVAGDHVVADGGELHRLLSDRGIYHLVYVGFHTNWCLQHKTYGMRAMRDRGYNVVLLRECTCAVETHETVRDTRQEAAAIRDIELQVGWTASVTDFLEGVRKREEDRGVTGRSGISSPHDSRQ